MTDTYVFDTGVLGQIVHPNILFENWFSNLEHMDVSIVIPEISDYELRRELTRMKKSISIERLNELRFDYHYFPLNTEIMDLAAELWARARNEGYQTAPNKSLDIDVILAAQTVSLIEDGYNAIIVTENVKHLSRYTNAETWQKL